MDRGITMVFEPLNRYELSFGTRVLDVARLVDAVDSPAMRMMIDSFHANIEETSFTDAFKTAGDRLAYVHAIDNHRGVPGTGHLDWGDFKAGIRGTGYDGPVVIEAIPHHVELGAMSGKIWHPPGPSPDALAIEGLRFLKELFGTQ